MKSVILLILIVCVALTADANLFAQDAENVEQVGRIYNQLDIALDVVVSDDLAYVAAGVSGLQIVDISNPDSPELVGYWDDNIWFARGVAVSGNYAYLANHPDDLHVVD